MRIGLRWLTVFAVVCALGAMTAPQPALAAKPVPGEFSLSLDTNTVDFGAIDPEVTAQENNAVRVTVDGYDTGTATLEVSYSATDFVNAAGGVPDIPVDCMTYALKGSGVARPFASGETIATESPTKLNWKYMYTFDFALTVPYDYEAGVYTTAVVYTAVLW